MNTMRFGEFVQDLAKKQNEYNIAVADGITKKQLCDICNPFRDKWEMTDAEALCIIRNEWKLPQIMNWFSEKFSQAE